MKKLSDKERRKKIRNETYQWDLCDGPTEGVGIFFKVCVGLVVLCWLYA